MTDKQEETQGYLRDNLSLFSGSNKLLAFLPEEYDLLYRVKNTTDGAYAFSRYCSEERTKANSASGALNKWLKSRVPEGCVIHSFRHSLRDRLRAVECPPDIADEIGGWCSSGVSQKYGSGHKLSLKLKYLAQII